MRYAQSTGSMMQLRSLLLKTLIRTRLPNLASPFRRRLRPGSIPASSVVLLPQLLKFQRPVVKSVSIGEEMKMVDVVLNEVTDAEEVELVDTVLNEVNNAAGIVKEDSFSEPAVPQMSKRQQKKLLKQERYEVKKLEKKAAEKEQKRMKVESKRQEWEERLNGVDEEERTKLIEERRGLRKERMDKRNEEKAEKIQRLNKAKECGQNIVIDLEFAHLMAPNEIKSLTQQIMYCYAMNGRSSSPSHLWLTGCSGDMETQLLNIPGYKNWIIEKESQSYIDALQDRKDDLVYLTADSETKLDALDPKKLYIVGGLVDRNRWKGITMNKATEQGIQTAKLPIGEYMKMSSSQVLTVNQVVEILLKFIETSDWKTSFFHVIPLRKRCEVDSEGAQEAEHEDDSNELVDKQCQYKKVCLENPAADS